MNITIPIDFFEKKITEKQRVAGDLLTKVHDLEDELTKINRKIEQLQTEKAEIEKKQKRIEAEQVQEIGALGAIQNILFEIEKQQHF